MADKKIQTEVLVDESLLTPDQLRDKLKDSREEAKRLNANFAKSKETIDSLGKQHNSKLEENEKLKEEIESLKEKLSRPVEAGQVEDQEQDTGEAMPSLKEIYLNVIRALVPTLAISGKPNPAGVTANQQAEQLGQHAIGISQILHLETRKKFFYRK